MSGGHKGGSHAFKGGSVPSKAAVPIIKGGGKATAIAVKVP